MRIFLRIIAVFLVVSVFSANSMNWLGRWNRKKSKKVVVTQEFVMDDMIGEVGEPTTKIGLCPIELENRYDRSIYEVGATLAQKAEWAPEYLEKLTQIILDFSTFNKKKKKVELLKTVSIPFLEKTIDFVATKNNALENNPTRVDEFFKAVATSLSYYEPNFNLYMEKMGVKRFRKIGYGEQGVSFSTRLGVTISRVRYWSGSEKDIIDKHYDKSMDEYKEFKKLVAQASKKWKKRKK